MIGQGADGRKLGSWIEGFFSYTESTGSPALFRKWAGISCLAGVLTRKVWTVTKNTLVTYPNLYTLLVGPPGVGKTLALNPVERFWLDLQKPGDPESLHVASTSVTFASLIDELNEARTRIVMPAAFPPYVEFNSLLVPVPELGVLIPEYDNRLMNNLTTLYDCGRYDESRRGRKESIHMAHTQLNMIGATTPSYLNNVMPEGAWDQGFISRVIILYSGEETVTDLWGAPQIDNALCDTLLADLRIIIKLFGQMAFLPEAQAAIQTWYANGSQPVPEHPRLLHYNRRRVLHLLKLCMIASVDRGNDLIVRMEDYETALGWLIEAELYMPDVFKSMSSTGDAAKLNEVWHFVFTTYAKEKKPIQQHRIMHFITERFPQHVAYRALQTMVQANMIEQKGADAAGHPTFIPTPKAVHSAGSG